MCGGDQLSQICGYLRHFSRKAWRQSWFVLKDKVLYEYGAPEDVCAMSSLPILGYSVNTEFKVNDYSPSIEIVIIKQFFTSIVAIIYTHIVDINDQ